MSTKESSIKCPKCGSIINVNEVLYHEIEERIKSVYEEKVAKEKELLQSKFNELSTKEEELKKEKEKLNSIIEQQVNEKLKQETNKLKESIRKQIEEEKSEQIDILQKELNLKSEQLKELNRTKAEIEKLKREKEELSEKIALEKEKEYSQKLSEERKKIKQQVEEENLLKIRELEKQLEEQKAIAKEALRKAEQGSMQRQGEIQELELENILRETHRFDEIKEIKKGQQGADVLQIVRNEYGLECGKIYYESKRTKHFHENWLQKLRDDNLMVKADILVLVTEAMPEGKDRFFLQNGVWICSLWEVKGLSTVLRHFLIQMYSISTAQQGRETKMEMLYNYLTSQEFSAQFGAIIEGFRDLQQNYHDERLKMEKIWKEREKQLEKILKNAVSFYGSIKGIAGASIPEIPMLDHPSKK